MQVKCNDFFFLGCFYCFFCFFRDMHTTAKVESQLQLHVCVGLRYVYVGLCRITTPMM